jgi:acetyl-CoA/propionyl-CoA carboxylase biotin carboxyl carrier protein
MLAKVIAHGADRAEALARLDAALGQVVVLGVGTNTGFLRALLADPDVRAGRLDTGLVGRRLDGLVRGALPADALPADALPADALPADALPADALPADVLPAAAGLALAALEPAGDVVDPFDIPGGWRIGEPAEVRWKMTVTGTTVEGTGTNEVRARGRADDALVAVGDAAPVRVRATDLGSRGRAAVTVDGITRDYAVALDHTGARDGATLWLGRDGQAWAIREQAPLEAAAASAAGAGGPVVSPMPGTVTVVEVTEGQAVAAGQRLLVVEAMKMEHVLAAPVDGIVRDLRAKPGATVAKDAVLAVIEPAPAPEDRAQEQQ